MFCFIHAEVLVDYGVIMLSVNSLNTNLSRVNFKSDESIPITYQKVNTLSFDEKQMKKAQRDYNNQRRRASIGQILGILSSVVVVALFGSMLFKDAFSGVELKKILKKIKPDSYNKDQITRALKEEYAKGPQSMSNKKINALVDLAEIPENETLHTVDIEKVKQILDKKIIGMDNFKEKSIGFLEYRNGCIEKGIKPDKPFVVLLVGPPGTCKTMGVKTIAEAIGMPFHEINMAGATGKAKIIGNEPVYTGASWGEFAEAQIKNKTKNNCYLIDELDKVGTSEHNGKTMDTLLPFLDGRHKAKDDFLGVDIDISDSIVFVTTNDMSKLSEPVLDRMSYIIKIEPYSREQKAAVAKLKFNNALDYHHITDNVEVDENIFKVIADSVTDEGGRQATEISENIVHDIFSSVGKLSGSDKFKVTEDFVKNWIEKSRKAA